MSYCVSYNSLPVKQQTPRPKRFKLWILSAAIVGLIAAMLFVPGFSLAVAQIVFPGFTEDAAQSLEVMVDQIAGGMAMDEALEIFCRQIFAEFHG